MIDTSKEYILCAAIKRKFPNNCTPYHDGTNDICNIEIGYRHHDIYQRFKCKTPEECILSFKMDDQGFYTSKGRFVDRYEGMKIAYEAGQVDEEIALNKSWMNIPLSKDDTIKEDVYKFNKLFSEDLY